VIAEPPAMPTQLISAIPAGPAACDSSDPHKVQNTASAQNEPAETRIRPPYRTPGVAASATRSQPAAAIRSPMGTVKLAGLAALARTDRGE